VAARAAQASGHPVHSERSYCTVRTSHCEAANGS
jgi:hypothetical protein